MIRRPPSSPLFPSPPLSRSSGITSLWRLTTGKDAVPEPEAQGPPLGAGGEVVRSGAFRFTRHPGNLGALGFFLLLPRMTANRAVLTALVALYVVLGSMHEEIGRASCRERV